MFLLNFAQHALGLFAAAAQSPFSNYWSKLTDPNRNPFRGLYQLNTFDLAIMIPYFLVLVRILAVRTGMHRCSTWCTWVFQANRKNVPERRCLRSPGVAQKGYQSTASDLQ